MRDHLIAVDVGTGSARAGVVTRDGQLLARREHPIEMRVEGDDIAEYSSEEIWSATAIAVRTTLTAAGITPDRIAAIAFDATCSLVLRDTEGAPLVLNPEGAHAFDTIAWLDHRAIGEADEVSATRHPVLSHSGELISPEMQIPKLMWLKRHRPDLWTRAGHFFDLADFLTWKASGSTARSLNTLSSKWTFRSHEKTGWATDFLAATGLEDLIEKGGLPQTAVAVGHAVGHLTIRAAAELGLDPGIPVAAGMVDAYAGALGVLGPAASDPDQLARQAALIGGTSSCLISFAPEPHFGRSLWGPFKDAVIPDQWLVEAGQSATGGLLNHLIRIHSAGGEPTTDKHQTIIARIRDLRAIEGAAFAARLNVLPDFHGNRSPFADPSMYGVISGLTLDPSFDGLCRIYWRACVAIALGLRQILDHMRERGFTPERLHLTGGHVKNPLLVELYGDVTGCDLMLPKTDDAVLIGNAINAAMAGGLYGSLAEAGAAMIPEPAIRKPDPATRPRYDRDYARFKAMQRHRAELDAM
ncbi:FGGY-family carbohydrate kinase [Rhizobium halophytocola]|uniref:FGGY-family pentulose kinase n=1 Tax=Rhizobium halophytocola TaxID=735519 RepID=A0ABS4DSX3_9HYPH|nr:FGGY-family carbohydrate kinase [Rhizobium halophytocola]MBP1848767.1 FGGY-family pentulose kinase [Rhizobium halophytocola]